MMVPMRLVKASLPVVVLLGLACASVPATVAGAADPALGEPFTLKPGATARLGEGRVTVGFTAVTADSRCPEDVQCVQAGEATVSVWLSTPGTPREDVRMTTGPRDNPVMAGGYELALQALTPVPSTKRTVRPADYRATFVVRRP